MKWVMYLLCGAILAATLFMIYTIPPMTGLPPDVGFDHNDFGYMPHYVKLHIIPEGEGISVVAQPSSFYLGQMQVTDNESNVIFPMVQSMKYTLTIDGNCVRYIYPHDSEYIVMCDK